MLPVMCMCVLHGITSIGAQGDGSGDKHEPQTARRQLSESKLHKMHKRGSTSRTSKGHWRWGWFQETQQRKFCWESLRFQHEGGWHHFEDKVALFSISFFINMWREQRLLLRSKRIQILEQCTQEASRFRLILRHVAKSTHQSWHSSWALSPYCTSLGLADIEIGCQLQMGSLSLAWGSI